MNKGIYKISFKGCKKVYIGSSKNLKKRKCNHLCSLRKGNHYNKYLQRAFNKNKEINFEFEILEITNNLLEREQFWIIFYNSSNNYFGYNLVPLVETGGKTGVIFKGKRRRNHLKMMEEKMWPTKRKHFKFIDSEGKLVEIFGLRQFCLKNKLCYKAMLNLHKGFMNTCHGYRKYFEDGHIEKHKGKNYIIKTPKGEILEINNLERFCKENNIWRRSLKLGWKSKGYVLINEIS